MKKLITWRLILVVLLMIGLFGLVTVYSSKIVFDVSRLSPTVVSAIVSPRSVEELRHIVISTDKPIAIAGGRFSQGGQIAYPSGLIIDIKNLNKIINLDVERKRITVQPGITWRAIQKAIDPHNLSVKVMQSYNDFTVGGSLSVNVHGRSELGSLIKTVESIKVLLADGTVVQASREENSDLFKSAIGGYGLIGIIIEATLSLTDNEKIERHVRVMPIHEYPHFFNEHIHHNKNVVFHNANIYPNAFNEVLSITWYASHKRLTEQDRLQEEGLFLKEKLEEQLLRRISPLKKLRQQIEPSILKETAVVWRNYEMSYSVEALEPLVRFPTTSILQEYFVPIHELIPFIDKIRSIVQRYDVNVLNISIRYVPEDHESIMAYARQESFALVCYINVLRTMEQSKEKRWTRALIDQALVLGGTYYLPYHLYATQLQFEEAYPRFQEFKGIKKKYDPTKRFMNSMYKKYLALSD